MYYSNSCFLTVTAFKKPYQDYVYSGCVKSSPGDADGMVVKAISVVVSVDIIREVIDQCVVGEVLVIHSTRWVALPQVTL